MNSKKVNKKKKNQDAFQLKRAKGYFDTISKIMMILMLTSIVFGSVLMFVLSKHTVDIESSKRNEVMLKQIENDADAVDKLLVNFSETILSDYQAYRLLHSFRISQEEYYRFMDGLKNNTLYSNGLIQEIYFYNAMNGKVYSSCGYLTLKEAGLNEVLVRRDELQKGIPIFRESQIGNNHGKVISTFFFSKDKLGLGSNNSFLAIDIAVDQFLGNFENEFSAKNRKVLITNENYDIQWQSEGGAEISDDVEFVSALKQYYEKGKSKFQYNGEDYSLTAIKYDKYGWNIVYINRPSRLYSSIQLMIMLWIALTGVFVFVGIYIAKKVARYIYQPIKDTIIQMQDISLPENNVKREYKEFQLIMDSVRASQKQKKELEFIKYKQRKAECEKIIRGMLEHSFELTDEKINTLNENLNCDLKIESSSLMIIAEFCQNSELLKEEKELLCFSMTNIFVEKIREKFLNYIYLIVNSSLVVILNGVTAVQQEEVVVLISEAKEIYVNYFGQNLQITMCAEYETLLDTTTAYERCLELSKYHTLGIYEKCITSQTIKRNEENKNLRYDGKLDEALKKAIYVENISEVKKVMNQIYESIKSLKYENVLFSLLHVTDYTQEILNEKNRMNLDSVAYDLTILRNSIFHLTSLEAFQEEYMRILSAFMKEMDKKKNSDQNEMLEKVKRYIDEYYSHADLCTQSIADKFKLSAKYLSYAFKEYTGVSLLNYLQKKRMDTACELLETTSMTVYEISYKIGIENENYFYTLFKKNVGMTPKQYRQSKIVV